MRRHSTFNVREWCKHCNLRRVTKISGKYGLSFFATQGPQIIIRCPSIHCFVVKPCILKVSFPGSKKLSIIWNFSFVEFVPHFLTNQFGLNASTAHLSSIRMFGQNHARECKLDDVQILICSTISWIPADP